MSRKSRHRGKHLPQSKKRRGRKGFSVPAQPSAASQRYEPTPRTEKVVPAAKAPTPRATVTLVQSINVAAELQRIGILAGIILVILVVLALVLP
jgi:hypothetical protein